MQISVVISTYNSPKWLEKVLWGYVKQSIEDFEVIVADDGSGPETKALIESFQQNQGLSLKHAWHEDDGFRKCEIMNKAIQMAETDYLVFSDGDCIPRSDFLEKHLLHRKPGRFLSGGYCKMSMETSQAITKEMIQSGEAFDPLRLESLGLKRKFFAKHNATGVKAVILNALTTTSPTWNGHNASAWKKDILAINGFDERMVYGGEDREFGERLHNSGINGKQIRYSAVCLHLDHPRGYVTREGIDFNKSIRRKTRSSKTVRTAHGIEK